MGSGGDGGRLQCPLAGYWSPAGRTRAPENHINFLPTKHLIIIAALTAFILPFSLYAEEKETSSSSVFKAEVVNVLDERTKKSDDGATFVQQNIRVKGMEGEWDDKELTIIGISDLEVATDQTVKVGDRILVSAGAGPDGETVFSVVDVVRTRALWILALLFFATVIAVSRGKGLRALVVLALTFIILLSFVLPQIVKGTNPLLVSVLGSVAILALATFFTEGFRTKSKTAFLSLMISLLIILALSWIFTNATKLTGAYADETMYLLGVAGGTVNIKGLLLAGIVIGALGVLDDVVISQVSTVREIARANLELSNRDIFRKAMKVGVDHINAIVNTLFLAYAGVSLPLLVLFSVHEPPFLTFEQVVNNEVLATEIVRTLVGSIALILAVPISTALAVHESSKMRHSVKK